jgi:hypothetical protein
MFGASGSTVAAPTVSDLSALAGLIDLLRHPDKAREAVDHLLDAAKASEQGLAAVREARIKLEADRTAQHAQISAERAAHDQALTRERQQWTAERSQREAQIAAWEKQAQQDAERAKQDAERAAKLKADLEQKLARLHALAA